MGNNLINERNSLRGGVITGQNGGQQLGSTNGTNNGSKSSDGCC